MEGFLSPGFVPSLALLPPSPGCSGGHRLCSKPNLESEGEGGGAEKLENQALGDSSKGGEKIKLGKGEGEGSDASHLGGNLA